MVKTYPPQNRPTSSIHPWPTPCISLTQILSFLLGLFGWMKNFPFQFLYFMSSFFTWLLVRLSFLVINSTYLLLHKQVTLNLSDLNNYFITLLFSLTVPEVDCVHLCSWLQPGAEIISKSFSVTCLVVDAIDMRRARTVTWPELSHVRYEVEAPSFLSSGSWQPQNTSTVLYWSSSSRASI